MPKALPRNYDRENADAAGVILAAPDRYGGPEALPCVWARLVLGRLSPTREGLPASPAGQDSQRGVIQGRLFGDVSHGSGD